MALADKWMRAALRLHSPLSCISSCIWASSRMPIFLGLVWQAIMPAVI